MTEPLAPAGATAPRRRALRPRRRTSVIGVIGELLITAGVFVLLFLGWQLWLNDIIVGNQADEDSVSQAAEWNREAPDVAPEPTAEPPVAEAPAASARLGYVIIPRFGESYYRPIAEGVGTAEVLNIDGQFGHYPGTQMPGAVGNFAVAAHRTTYGASLGQIAELRVGDHVYIETKDGWYRYTFRNLEYVAPNGVGVLDPVPQQPGESPGDRLLTMTSCNPKFSAAERIIAYSAFDAFFPRVKGAPAGGAPAEIADTVAGKAS